MYVIFLERATLIRLLYIYCHSGFTQTIIDCFQSSKSTEEKQRTVQSQRISNTTGCQCWGEKASSEDKFPFRYRVCCSRYIHIYPWLLSNFKTCIIFQIHPHDNTHPMPYIFSPFAEVGCQI